jgi:hypothetical protein
MAPAKKADNKNFVVTKSTIEVGRAFQKKKKVKAMNQLLNITTLLP